MQTKTSFIALTAAAVTLVPLAATANGELNLYSSRHYDTDERLYSDFTEATGITINRIEGKADELIERMKLIDVNYDGEISYDEFVTGLAGISEWEELLKLR